MLSAIPNIFLGQTPEHPHIEPRDMDLGISGSRGHEAPRTRNATKLNSAVCCNAKWQ